MLKNNELENKVANKRTKVLLYFIFILFLIIISRILFLQFLEHDKYKEKAYNNVTKEIKLSPKRGVIYDRDHNEIAGNRALYELTIVPEKIYGYRKNKKESVDKLFNDLENVIDLTEIDQEKTKNKILNTPSFKEVVLLSDLSELQLSSLTANIKYIDGLAINARYVRQYPYNDLFLSLLGYVGRISEEDLKKYPDLDLLSNDFLGKIGLEKEFNKKLYGEPGIDKIVINAYGKIVDRKKSIPPKNGDDIVLSVDTDLQKIAYDELNKINKNGAVVAVDLETGEILTFFSNPTYDANKFLKKISQEEYDKFFKKESPLFNRVVQGQYPPASTIKPIMSMAGLQGEFIKSDDIINSGAYYTIGTQKFRDWKKWGHGKIDMIQAIAVSSDFYFYKLAHNMGIEYMHDFISFFGYGKIVDIPFPNQKSGLLPSNEWKQKVYKEPFYAGDTVIVGIGQGSFLATPIQMLNSTSIIANEGKQLKFHFFKNEKPEITYNVNVKNEYFKVAKEGMREVMHGQKGTGRNYVKNLPFIMAGKTGTAQVFSTNGQVEYKNEETLEHLKDHGLFIGFAPYENPKIAVAVVVEHGEGSSSATPIAVKILTKYLEKNNLIKKEVIENEEAVK